MNTSKILVVDDEEDLREALRTSLTAAGCEVVVAKDGAEGLSQALSYKPDLILLDINMPNMNGHQVLRELRRDAWGKKVSVILLTNADDATNIAQGVGLEGDDYIIKSQTSLESITKKVKQYLAGYHD
jgi:DNA-binding response OmpR family regulator